MHEPETHPWTIEDLGSEVARALSTGYAGQSSGRVRHVPDPRTIRYYTTLGILDRPRLSGRTALYGPRHLLQLVAIKRLQARGLSLARVQRELLGLDDRGLARIAALEPRDAGAREAPRPAPRDRFWAMAPRPEREAGSTGAPAVSRAPAGPASGPLRATIEIAPGVLLVLPGGRLPDAEDVSAVRDACAAVLGVIEARGLGARPRLERSEA